MHSPVRTVTVSGLATYGTAVLCLHDSRVSLGETVSRRGEIVHEKQSIKFDNNYSIRLR